MNPVTADESAIQKAADLLRQGKLVAIPTETVYGLGADAKNPEAVKRIFAAKGRPADHPLIVHILDKAALEEWAIEIPEIAWKLADRFWPGPLTIVLLKHPDVPMEVTGGQDTVALRVPNHPVALSVLQKFGGGIAAPSANRYCRISPTLASHVEEELGDKVDMILDGGACQVGLESTIVDLSSGQPKLLRPGQISKSQIEEVMQTELDLPQHSHVRAPGMMKTHYSPEAHTIICSIEQIKKIIDGELFQHQYNIGVLAFGNDLQDAKYKKIISMPTEVNSYAHNLYSALRKLDDEWIDIILVQKPPQTVEWLAVNDRLVKAARSSYEEHEDPKKPRVKNGSILDLLGMFMSQV